MTRRRRRCGRSDFAGADSTRIPILLELLGELLLPVADWVRAVTLDSELPAWSVLRQLRAWPDWKALPMGYAKTGERKEKRLLREKMRSMGLGYRDIAGEFGRRYRLRPRAAWREAYGWSLTETAGRINDFRGNTGLDPGGIASMTSPHLSEYETWPGHGPQPAGRRPNPYLLAVLAAVYDCSVTDLIDIADREHLPPADLLILDKYGSKPTGLSGQSAVGTSSQAPSGLPRGEQLGDSGVPGLLGQVALLPRHLESALRHGPVAEAGADGRERAASRAVASPRQVGDAAAGDAAGLPLQELGDHAVELGAWAEAGTAGPGTIAALEDEVARVMAAYGSSAAGPLILRAMYACQRASGLLREHQRLRHTRDLYVVAARCCAFLAVALGDLGRQAEGAVYARTALTLAEESADPGAVALACSALSKVAFWDGLRRKSADLAARGLAAARVSDPMRVLLVCQQADASPVSVARDVLALARAAREETAGSGEADGGLFSCGGVRLAGYAATLGLREGSLEAVLGAAAMAEAAIRDGEQAPYGSLAQVRLCAALALLASGDADQASEHLAPVLGLPPEMRLATFTGRLSQCAALASATPYKSSVTARGIVEEVAGYLGAAPVAMPHPLAIGPGSVR